MSDSGRPPDPRPAAVVEADRALAAAAGRMLALDDRAEGFAGFKNEWAPAQAGARMAMSDPGLLPAREHGADLIAAGVVVIAEAVARGETSAEAITREALDRLETRGRALNGIALLEPARALEQAHAVDRARAAGTPLGPLAGVPMAHKDLLYRAGRPAACGSRIRQDFVPDVTATVLSRLDAAGAVDCGTVHMTEFAFGPTGYNKWLGRGLNPHDPARVCGGSSSGSGIVVGAGCVPAALGSDSGGSIRHPAAFCGVAGLKPTHGAVSLAGAMPLAPSLDCIGPLARHARDLARLYDVLAPGAGCEAALAGAVRGLRLAVPRGYYDEALDTDAAAALGEARTTLSGLGMVVGETMPPDMAVLNGALLCLLSVEAAARHRPWLEARPQDYAPQVRARIEPGFHFGAVRYAEALALRAPLAREWLEAVLGDADVALLPAVPMAAPRVADIVDAEGEEDVAVLARITRNTRAISYLGLPAVALPCGRSAEGMPLGLQLVGRPWSEPLLLRVADAFQRVTDWHVREWRPERDSNSRPAV